MARHNETGKLGEQLALQWAMDNEFHIREQNWRFGKWEIDLIASKNDRLHFFEVKNKKNQSLWISRGISRQE